MSEPTLSHGHGRRPSAGQWTGPKRPYDLAKEFVIALIVVGLLSVVAALVLSSPDVKAVTLQRSARQAPADRDHRRHRA